MYISLYIMYMHTCICMGAKNHGSLRRLLLQGCFCISCVLGFYAYAVYTGNAVEVFRVSNAELNADCLLAGMQ